MASIKKVRTGYRARWRTPDGASRSRTFKRRVDAERFMTTVESSKLTGGYVDPSSGRVTFETYAEQWRAGQVHRETTAATIGGHLRAHILPTFGRRPISSVRPSEVQAWVRGRVDAVAPSTVEQAYRTLAAVFRAAVADRLIASSPCFGIKLPKCERPRVVPLETAQVTALAAAAPDEYRALIVATAGTGLRQGEAFAISTDSVDFLRRTLHVEQQIITINGRGPQLAPPKTPASRRLVPLPQVVLDALAAHLAMFPAAADGLLFTDSRGRPLRRDSFGRVVWRPAVQAVGLPAGVGFHALRHYYASLLIRHGESVTTVQHRLGHKTAKETLDTYSHLWPDSEDRTRIAVDAEMGAGVTEQAPLSHMKSRTASDLTGRS